MRILEKKEEEERRDEGQTQKTLLVRFSMVETVSKTPSVTSSTISFSGVYFVFYFYL